MNVLILQPPIVQLNTVYPSGAYLSAFFKKIGCKTKWVDLNLLLFYKIFSRQGLTRLFELSSEKALEMAAQAEKKGDEGTAFNLRRYVSQQDLWCQWIDVITALLRGDDFEGAHRFVFGAHVPRGNRMESFLANLNHDLTTDDARSLASYALADLADYITAVFDQNFALVRYAESLTVSENSFSQIEKGADSPILKEFFQPLLEELFLTDEIRSFLQSQPEEEISFGKKSLICVSVPFPGTFTPALAIGRFFKKHYGKDAFISFGGGFINTELRESKDPALSKYCDSISFDRGYGGYGRILNKLTGGDELTNGRSSISPSTDSPAESYIFPNSLYKTRLFLTNGRSPLKDDPKTGSPDSKKITSTPEVTIVDPLEVDKEAQDFERLCTATITPDFTDIDFKRYPQMIDDTNPMHRLWSDGAWIKAYMAHGCYWHQCAFCDVTLDYVKGYCPTNVKALYKSLLETARAKGVYGIHFVDEAMPPAALIAFARENIAHGCPLSFWGNIRFEKVYTRDVADFLAYGGLVGVSGGIESANGDLLDVIHKGVDLPTIVGACCAFKEAGVLVHAYMIYGYWQESPQDLINSMETLRQFYANGLLDSSFWHKFVLTRHSRVFKEWKEGKIQDLVPIVPDEKNQPLFAKNGLHFEGEKKSQKFGNALDYSLDRWMHGEDLNRPVGEWFNFPVPHPTVSKKYIAKMIEEYERKRDQAFGQPLPEDKKLVFWLGGKKLLEGKKVRWFYMGEMEEEKAEAPDSAYRGRGLCVLPDWCSRISL